MNYKIITWVLAAIIGTFLGLVIVGLIFDDEPDYKPPTTNLTNLEPRVDVEAQAIAEMRQQFMAGCSPDGTDYAYCSCVWTEMSADKSAVELYDYALGISDAEMIRLADYCTFSVNPV